MEKKLLRIMDANLNRAREGLRVCEDITRFAICDKNIAKLLKFIRHGVTKALINSKNISLETLSLTRDVKKDRSKFVDFKKERAAGLIDLLMSNIERVKESLRVLEECSKIIDEHMSRKYRYLRFKTYDAEKKIIKKIRLVSCNR